MARKNPGTIGRSASWMRTSGNPVAYPKSINIEDLESKAIAKTSHTMSIIENAIAVWDATKEKPDHLRHRFLRLKNFYEALSKWEREALMARREEESTEARLVRLHEFSVLCHSFA